MWKWFTGLFQTSSHSKDFDEGDSESTDSYDDDSTSNASDNNDDDVVPIQHDENHERKILRKAVVMEDDYQTLCMLFSNTASNAFPLESIANTANLLHKFIKVEEGKEKEKGEGKEEEQTTTYVLDIPKKYYSPSSLLTTYVTFDNKKGVITKIRSYDVRPISEGKYELCKPEGVTDATFEWLKVFDAQSRLKLRLPPPANIDEVPEYRVIADYITGYLTTYPHTIAGVPKHERRCHVEIDNVSLLYVSIPFINNPGVVSVLTHLTHEEGSEIEKAISAFRLDRRRNIIVTCYEGVFQLVDVYSILGVKL